MKNYRAVIRDTLKSVQSDIPYDIKMAFPESKPAGNLITFYEITNTGTELACVDVIAYQVDLWFMTLPDLLELTEKVDEALNGVIKLVNNMVGKINDKLLISVGSTLSNVLSALGVSVTNGQYQLFSIPTIPELEKGGVLKKGQVGLLEGKGAEAVVPLERNTQWISKVAAMMVQMLGSSGQAVNVTIPVYVGGKHLSTVVLDDVNQTEKKGRDPVTATA